MTTKQLYLSTALALFLIQAMFTFHAFDQVRFEEVYESVKAAYFFQHQQVISGLHTNVGWYAILVAVYNIFGFTLHTGQFIRLGIAFFSLLSLALLFNKYFKDRLGLIPFVAIGTSPTLLFFNTQNLHLGFDLQMLPIWLLILVNIKFAVIPSDPVILNASEGSSSLADSSSDEHRTQNDKQRLWNDNIKNYILTALLFSLLMFSALTYPASAFYIPAFGLFFLYKLKSHFGTFSKPYLAVAAIAFLVPLIAIFAYTQNRDILIYDEMNKSGLFRGGGKIVFSENVFKQGFDGLIRDLFIKAGSYHYEVGKVDFSDLYPVVGLIFALYVTLKVFAQDKSSQKIVALIFLVLISNLFIVSITSDYGVPGMKRATSTLAALYGFFILAWYYVLKDGVKLPVSKTVAICLLSLITIHNVLVLPENLTALKRPSPFKMADWFDGDTNPQESLDMYLKELQEGNLILNCDDVYEQNPNCEYTFIYSAISGSCLWNHLSCHAIKKSDGKEIEFEDLLER